METEESRRERIRALAFKKMSTVGVSGFTMDDIARGVGMSKATVYRLYPSKEALALETVETFSGRITEQVGASLRDPGLSDEQKLSSFLAGLAGWLGKIRPEALEDILRSMPPVAEKIEQARRGFVFGSLLGLLRDGKCSGLFRPDLDETLAAHMLVGAVAHLLSPDVLPTLTYPTDELFTRVIRQFLHGCLSEQSYSPPSAPPRR